MQEIMKKREAIMKDRPDNKDSIKKILDLLTDEQKDELLLALLTGQAGQQQRGRQAAGGRGGAGGGRQGAGRPGGDRPGGARPGGDRPGGDQGQRRRRPDADK